MTKLATLLFIAIPIFTYSQFGSRNNIGTFPIHANPAFTGILNNGAINSNLTLNEYDYFIINTCYHTHLPKSNSGIGLALGTKRYEYYSISKYGLTYSYQSKISEKLTLSAGFGVYFTTDRDDYFPEFDTSFFSFDGGIILYSKNIFISLSAFNFNSRFETLNLKSSFGYRFSIKKLTGFSFTPVIGLALENKSGYINARINTDFKKIKFVIGAASNGFLTGLGYENRKFGLHYMFSLINSQESTWFRYNNRFSMTIKLPKSIERKTNSFDLQLF